MSEPFVRLSHDENVERKGRAQPVEGEPSGSRQASLRTSDPGIMGRQDFSNVHTADNSRNHFGNVVHNHVYPDNATHPEFDNVMQELMDALAFKGMTDRVMAISPACAATCTWFLHNREYISWRDPARRYAHNGVLWIKGKAGTGKSTLMRYIHDYAQEHHQDEVDIAFFFNGRSPDPLAKSVEGMYRSILYQLYERIPRLGATAAKRVAITNKQVWSTEILEDMIRQSVLHLKSDENATVYIDALDECESDQVRSAVEFFESLSRSATAENKQFSICFSSRFYPHITVQSHEEVRLDTLVEHSSDIKTFLASEFTIRSPLRSELQVEIERRCSGIFLWVVLVVKLLKRRFDKGATRPQLRETLRSVPRELNELFGKITESAGSEFAIAIRWVLCARVSLGPAQLYFAIQISSGRLCSVCWDTAETNSHAIRNYILHVSKGLIECTWESEEEETVQFIHESVREYFQSWGLSSLDGASSRELEITSHAKMLQDCQKCLKLCARCRERSLPLSDADVSREDAKFLRSHPLLNYVLNQVFTHMELAHTAGIINHGLLDAFPLSDFVRFYNIYEVREDSGHCAILAHHTATLLMLLISFKCYNLADFTLRFQQGLTKRGQKFIKSSVAAGPDLETCCGGIMPSPLHAAVASGREALVELLLEKGADVNIYMPGSMSPEGVIQLCESPLMMAVKRSNAAMIKLLLDHGARADSLSPLNGWSALHEACLRRLHYDPETIKLLISKAVTVDLRAGHHSGANDSNQGWTALGLACDAWPGSAVDSTASVLRALLDAGADVNAIMMGDRTPLIFAVSRNKLEAAKVLLDYGANTEYYSAKLGNTNVAADPLMLETLASEIRMRALQGRNRHLRPAPRPEINRIRAPSQIAVPVQPRSRRREMPLWYRHPPQAAPLPQVGTVHALTDSNLQFLNDPRGFAGYPMWSTYVSSGHMLGSEMSSRDWSEWSDSDEDLTTVLPDSMSFTSDESS